MTNHFGKVKVLLYAKAMATQDKDCLTSQNKVRFVDYLDLHNNAQQMVYAFIQYL